MELQVLFSGVPYTGTLPQGEAVLVTQDSRRACPGAVFVCARGMTTDGHDHARKALEAGAVCIVTERPLGLPGEVQVASGRKAYAQLCQNFFGRPAEKLRLVAVTGTNGKTTVTTLIKQTLEQAGCKAGLIGTIHTEIDAMDVPAKYTTPEPWDLNALFSRMVLAGCTFAVMEASSQALDQLRLWGLTFEVGVFTNLTQDHLDYHKTFENYFAAKKSLFSQVKHMVVNLDDSYGRHLLDEVHGPERTFSAGDDVGDCTARNIRLSASGEVRDGGLRLHPAHRFPHARVLLGAQRAGGGRRGHCAGHPRAGRRGRAFGLPRGARPVRGAVSRRVHHPVRLCPHGRRH
ncbi:Mur ligase family protein [Ruthenibacterium lactatiformans]|uniref:Mur ligase family protein n=1 Tax=Ruthenibacterium lactatiformans TaxID=1550024 RepID=UPI00399F4466